jgi:DNA polymerase-3 subunit epsilon
VDVETTGLDQANDQVIELAIQRFRYNDLGEITEIGLSRSWKNDPGVPIDPKITKLTGLTSDELQGHRIDLDMAAFLLGSANIIIAHNASFDRPFVDKLLPIIKNKPWACTITDIDWANLGYEGRALSHLLMQCGWFFDAHRASNDVLALLYLLAQQVENDKTVLSLILRTVADPVVEIIALKAPYETREVLKRRGYRWSDNLRAWRIEVREAEVTNELGWLEAEIYRGSGAPVVNPIGMNERYRASGLPL